MGSATILTRKSDKPILKCTGDGATVVIRDLTFDGKNMNASGISILDADLLRLENLHIKNCGVPGYGDGHTNSYDGAHVSNTETAIVKSCIFESCERDGFKGDGIRHLSVEQSRFINIGRMGIVNDVNDYSRTSPLSSQVIGNLLENCGNGGIHTEAYLEGQVCEVTFVGNIVKNCCDDDWGYPWGIVAGNNTSGVISSNVILNCGTEKTFANGIMIGNTGGGLVISDNVIDNTGASGISVNRSRNNEITISDNVIRNAGKIGVSLYMAPHTAISGNTISNSQETGIDLSLCSYSTISANNVRNNSRAGAKKYSGITSRKSYELVITGNNINGSNHEYGYNLDNNAYAVHFFGNNIRTFATEWFSGAYGMELGTIKGTRKQFHGTSEPLNGSWLAGDKIMNTNPVAGGYVGWICVDSGSPGTWKGFGLINP
jgi:parallel beta-helix repeat protein